MIDDDSKTFDKMMNDMCQKMGITSEMINPDKTHKLCLELSLDDMIKVVDFCRSNNIGIKQFGSVGN